MLDLLDELSGDRLSLEDYLSDYSLRLPGVQEEGSWKLEREQAFVEPGNVSWEAFTRGEWDASARFAEERRQSLRDSVSQSAAQGFVNSRVRIVEKPFSPYLHWELNMLRIRAECGELIRVLDASAVASLEVETPLPEIVTLGADTVYRVLYEDGAVVGAIRTIDPALALRWREFIQDLYRSGEEVGKYFSREVAGLEPPHFF